MSISLITIVLLLTFIYGIFGAINPDIYGKVFAKSSPPKSNEGIQQMLKKFRPSLPRVSYLFNLTEKNITEFLTTRDVVFVSFVDPTLMSYERFARSLQRLSVTLKGKLAFGQVNCREELSLCSEFKKLPVLRFYRNKKIVEEFSGTLSMNELVQSIQKQVVPIQNEFTTTEQVKNFIAGTEYAFLAFLEKVESEEYERFITIAQDKSFGEGFKFGVVVPPLAYYYSIDYFPTYRLYKGPEQILYKRDEPLDEFDEPEGDQKEKDLAHMIRWIHQMSEPFFEDITSKKFKLMDPKKPLAILFYDNNSNKNEIMDFGRKIAQQYRKQLTFGHGNGENFPLQFESMAGTGNKLPCFVIEEPSRGKRYLYDNFFEEESVKIWLDSVLSGKEKEIVRSAKPSTTPSKDSIVNIVASTWDEIVMDPKKDVFVEFYAPWCSHCRTITPIWKKLAQEFIDIAPTLVIASIDVSMNDVPEEIFAFPLFKFYPVGDKTKATWYTGPRTYQSIRQYIVDKIKLNEKLLSFPTIPQLQPHEIL